MRDFINQNSALLLAILVFGMAAWGAWDYRKNKRALLAIAAILIVITVGYAQVRHGQSDASSVAEFDAVFAAGAPVVLEIYSDTCVVCLASKHAVDDLEVELEGKATVVRMNIGESVGKAVARQYGAFATPSFIVLSSSGIEQYRQYGYPDSDRLVAEVLAAQ
jgi:thiol-disulfide isomerase/thioredoxin